MVAALAAAWWSSQFFNARKRNSLVETAIGVPQAAVSPAARWAANRIALASSADPAVAEVNVDRGTLCHKHVCWISISPDALLPFT